MASAANIWAAAWEALEPGAEGAAATAMGIITGAAMAAMEELTALISEVAAGEVGGAISNAAYCGLGGSPGGNGSAGIAGGVTTVLIGGDGGDGGIGAVILEYYDPSKPMTLTA